MYRCPTCDVDLSESRQNKLFCGRSCSEKWHRRFGVTRPVRGNQASGKSTTRLYAIWRMMVQRCTSITSSRWRYYGGRGIQVCDEWRSFTAFESWASATGYSDKLTIDRINNDGNYEPTNCRWSTRKEQNRNTRANRRISVGGRTLTLVEWSEQSGAASRKTIHNRLKAGWTAADAVFGRGAAP